jgi:hypothetical protein
VSAKALFVKRIFPFRHNYRSHTISNEIGERACLGHEAVDAQNESDARDWN